MSLCEIWGKTRTARRAWGAEYTPCDHRRVVDRIARWRKDSVERIFRRNENSTHRIIGTTLDWTYCLVQCIKFSSRRHDPLFGANISRDIPRVSREGFSLVEATRSLERRLVVVARSSIGYSNDDATPTHPLSSHFRLGDDDSLRPRSFAIFKARFNTRSRTRARRVSYIFITHYLSVHPLVTTTNFVLLVLESFVPLFCF